MKNWADDVVRSVLNAQHRADEERILAVKREKVVQKTQVRFKLNKRIIPSALTLLKALRKCRLALGSARRVLARLRSRQRAGTLGPTPDGPKRLQKGHA